MKKYVRTKLVFTGTEETLKPLMQKLASVDGTAPVSFAAIIPLSSDFLCIWFVKCCCRQVMISSQITEKRKG